MEVALAIVAIVAGATLQQATGLGFALVSGPFLVLLLPPYEGVVLANALSLAVCLIILAGGFRRVDLRRTAALCVGVVAAVPLGAWVARQLPSPMLLVAVGALTVIAAGTVILGRPITSLRRRGGAVAAGIASGFGNVTAGIGGPPLAIYGASVGWAKPAFVPSVQLVGAVTNAASLLAKRDGQLPPGLVVIGLAGVLLGVVVGRRLDRVVPADVARQVVLGLALVGGLASVVKGLVTMS